MRGTASVTLSKKIYTHYNAYLEARSQVATELDDVRLGHSK